MGRNAVPIAPRPEVLTVSLSPKLVVSIIVGFVSCGVVYIITRQKKKKFSPRRNGKLYASAISTCSRKIIMALEETQTGYEFAHINLAKKEQKDPEYLKIQPYGKVPVWEEDGDWRIHESRAILKHVTSGSALYPTDDVRLTAQIDMWISIEYSYFGQSWGPIFLEKILKPRGDKTYQPDEAKCAKSKEGLLPTLDLMESQFAKTHFLAGDQVTIANITFLPYVFLFGPAGLKETLAEPPALHGWVGKITSPKSMGKL
eukprot:FR742222.1.p1 GENE.FR742222.1~~FR742222.1.p1  ORF type:complete len:258 (+),score=37.14 FR742222.1:61-834(+)